MSQTARRTVFYSVILWVVLLVLAAIPVLVLATEPHTATAIAEPLPWWQQVEDFQALALKWIAAMTVTLGALATLAAFMIAKYQDIKGRLDRHDVRAAATLLAATAIPPASVGPTETIIVNDPRHPVPVAPTKTL